MPNFERMYYHLAGRMAASVEVLETTTDVLQATAKALQETTNALQETSFALVKLKEKIKLAQQTTEEMFLSDDDEPEDPDET